MDLETAYRILDLRPGADFKQLSEAREDLLILWDPQRLANHPRLKSRASTKISEINAAYETVIDHLGQTELRSSLRASGTPRTQSSASLVNELFTKERRRHYPRVILIAVVALVLLLIILFWPSADSTPPAVQSPDPGKQTAEPSGPGEEPASVDPDSSASEQPASSESRVEQPASRSPSSPGAPSSGTRSPALPVPKRPESERPVLIRAEAGVSGAQAQQEEDEADLAFQAYDLLLRESGVARSLVQGVYQTLKYQGWQADVQQPAGEIWVDLVAKDFTGSERHFVWAVGLATGRVRPLNSEALRLEEASQ